MAKILLLHMISTRSTAEGNAQRSDEALKFVQLFFLKQDTEKTTLCEMYHDQATLIWDGEVKKPKSSIAKYYQSMQPTTTTLQAIDAQIMPQMGDIIDMITIIVGGSMKQSNKTFNFSRTFLLGANAPGTTEYLIVSDTMRTQLLS